MRSTQNYRMQNMRQTNKFKISNHSKFKISNQNILKTKTNAHF